VFGLGVAAFAGGALRGFQAPLEAAPVVTVAFVGAAILLLVGGRAWRASSAVVAGSLGLVVATCLVVWAFPERLIDLRVLWVAWAILAFFGLSAGRGEARGL
jgi:hypothetical protein